MGDDGLTHAVFVIEREGVAINGSGDMLLLEKSDLEGMKALARRTKQCRGRMEN